MENGKANVLEAIDNELLSVEKMVEQIKREKDAGEHNVKVKLAQLDSKAATFRGLLANLQSFITNMQKQDIDFEPLPMPGDVPANEVPSQDGLSPLPENPPSDSQSHDEQKDHADDAEKLGCSNPACVNYRKKVLPVDTKFCPECGSVIVKDVPLEPGVKDEKIACPNPECKNHHQKVLSPNTKFCPECGTKIVAQSNEPEPTSPTYVIDPRLDKYEKDGVVYYKLASANQDEENHSLCYHEENRCGGEMYLGNNGMLICGKCGKGHKAIYAPETLKITGSILSKFTGHVNMKWYIELIENLEDKKEIL